MNSLLPPVVASQPATTLVTTPAQSHAWRVGTVLEALALSSASAGSVRLQIGARVVNASTGLDIQSGQTLRLRVAETGRTVVLKPESSDPVPERVRTGIREALPRQAAQAPLLASAASAARRALPPPLLRALATLEGAVSEARQLTSADGLRRAVRDSGNFLEHRLAAGTTALPHDWKAALLRAREQFSRWLATQATRATSATATATPPGAGAGASSGRGAAIPSGATLAQPPALQLQGVAAQPLPAVPAPLPAAPTASASPSATGNPAAVATNTTVPSQSLSPPMRQTLPAVQPVVADARVSADTHQLVAELVQQTRGALARVRLNQLVTVTPDPVSKTTVWLLELPVRHDNGEREIVPLRIERDERSSQSGAERGWTVDLAFDLGAGGELRARVALHGGRVYTSFQAASEATRATIMARIDKLADAMAAQEISVGSVSCGPVQTQEPQPGATALLETSA